MELLSMDTRAIEDNLTTSAHAILDFLVEEGYLEAELAKEL